MITRSLRLQWESLDSARGGALGDPLYIRSGAHKGSDREAGENPARSRHCEWGAIFESTRSSLAGEGEDGARGRGAFGTHEPGDLPGLAEDAMPRGCRPTDAEIARGTPSPVRTSRCLSGRPYARATP